ncbi:MAG TPA: alpha/beta hydrolase [Candidatus Tumulicola sp.]|nr:alpha/beta hydrolase [Candidatus Tumulicola sp.]
MTRECVRAGGRDLEYVKIPAAREGLPVLVFLHEGLGTVALWREFPAALAERTGCGALVYSRYGNGFSTPLAQPRTPGYMHDEALAVLPEVLRELDVGETILVGHSDGASIALIYAAAHPAAVRGLVLEAPHVFVEELSVQSIAAVKGEYENGLRERMAGHHADVDRTFYGWNDIWLAPEFRDWNIETEVRRVRTPAFVLQGRKDQYGTPAQVEAIAAGSSARVDSLLLAGCAHAPHRDRRALVEETAAAWIRERIA